MTGQERCCLMFDAIVRGNELLPDDRTREAAYEILAECLGLAARRLKTLAQEVSVAKSIANN